MYSAYCYGLCSGNRSTVSYVIFKDGDFVEEHAELVGSERHLRQQTISLCKLTERLIALNATDIVIYTDSVALKKRLEEVHYRYFKQKETISEGIGQSYPFKAAEQLSRLKVKSLIVIPKCDNLRARFLASRLAFGWDNRPFYWKDELPVVS